MGDHAGCLDYAVPRQRQATDPGSPLRFGSLAAAHNIGEHMKPYEMSSSAGYRNRVQVVPGNLIIDSIAQSLITFKRLIFTFIRQRLTFDF